MNFENQTISEPPRSNFVNVLAWIFIVLGGFATLISIMQNIMIHTMFPKEKMAQAMQQADKHKDMPAFFKYAFSYFDVYFLFFLIICSITFISAIALLKRKNWARNVFIGLMTLGILWNIGGLILQYTMMGSMHEFTGQHTPPEMETMLTFMKIFTLIMVLAMSTLFAWIIKKLTSDSIKAEFV